MTTTTQPLAPFEIITSDGSQYRINATSGRQALLECVKQTGKDVNRGRIRMAGDARWLAAAPFLPKL